MTRDIFWIMGFQLLSRGALIVFGIVLSHVISADVFFEYQYFITTVNTLLIYTMFGMNVFSMRQAAKFEKSGDTNLSDNVWIALLVAFTLLVIGMGLAYTIGYQIFFEPSSVPVWVYFLVLVALSLHAISMAGLNGLKQYRRIFLVTLLANVALLFSFINLILGWSVGLLVSVGAYAGYFIISCSVMIVFLGSLLPPPKKITKIRVVHAVRRVLVDSLPIFLVSVCIGTLFWIIGRTLVAQGADLTVFSTYAVCLQLYALLIFVPNAVGMRLFPEMVKTQTGLSDLQKQLIWTAGWKTFGLTTCVCVVLFLMTPVLQWIYGDVVAFGHSELFVLAVMAAISAPMRILGETIVAQNKSWLWFVVNFSGLCMCFALLFGLKPETAFGALASLAMCYGAMLVISYLFYKSKLL